MSHTVQNAGEATRWGLFELSLNGPSDGNPFVDIRLMATFEKDGRSVEVDGFYDGEGVYRVRFMPDEEGEWSYETASNAEALDGVGGTVRVGPAAPGAHGPVRVSDRHHFRHADGTRFIAIGTTAYVWNHQGEQMERQTLASLAEAPFTKIRMCVFPKHYRYNENEPEHYPFPVLKRGTSEWSRGFANTGWDFDYERFEPAFFRHLERRIADLAAIGVEADLIVLHPYDRWGFSRMSAEQDDRYLRYLVARLAGFANVWWSMANEYDLMPMKSLADWDRLIKVVADSDPYGHLLSIHNCFGFYDHADPRLTHASIQRPDPARSALWRHRYGKPVAIDECCYEGDIAEAWGNISGREMVHRFWEGTVNGGYVTHGECFRRPGDVVWWAKGGTLTGESVARIAFLRRILEAGPEGGLDPMEHTGPYRIMLAGGLDEVVMGQLFTPVPGEEDWERVHSQFATAGRKHSYYLTYFGRNQPTEFPAAVPPGERYDAVLIDTWEMTETPIATGVVRGQQLRLPARPYQAVLLRRADV